MLTSVVQRRHWLTGGCIAMVTDVVLLCYYSGTALGLPATENSITSRNAAVCFRQVRIAYQPHLSFSLVINILIYYAWLGWHIFPILLGFLTFLLSYFFGLSIFADPQRLTVSPVIYVVSMISEYRLLRSIIFTYEIALSMEYSWYESSTSNHLKIMSLKVCYSYTTTLKTDLAEI